MIKVESMPELSKTFKRYSGWSGADGIYTFNRGNKVLWYFSDTFVGDSDKETDKRIKYSFINNSFGISSKHIDDIEFIYPDDVSSCIVPKKEGYYWLQDGIVIGDSLYIFCLHMKNQLLEGLPFAIEGVDVIKYDLTNISKFKYEIIETKDFCFDDYIFGASTLDNRELDGYIYIYGYKNIPGNKQVVLSRVKYALNNQIEYLNSDDSWSTQKKELKILAEHFAAEFKVIKIKDKYFCVYTLDSMGKDIYSVESNNIEEKFSNIQKIYECPEHLYKPNWMTYNAKIQKALSSEKELIVSYSVNTLVNSEHEDLNIYYPRFFKIYL